mgnify:CR=1 FL=1
MMKTIAEAITRAQSAVVNYVNTPLTDDNYWQMTVPFLIGTLAVIGVGIFLCKRALKNTEEE